MQRPRSQREIMRRPVRSQYRLHLPTRITQIPRQPIAIPIQMTHPAGHRPIATQARIVKIAATLLHLLWQRFIPTQIHLRHHHRHRRVHINDTYSLRQLVENKQPPRTFIPSQTARTPHSITTATSHTHVHPLQHRTCRRIHLRHPITRKRRRPQMLAIRLEN